MEVPCEIFPPDTGLIVADAFGAQIICEAPEHRLPAATRKSHDACHSPAPPRCGCNRWSTRTGPMTDLT